MRWSSKYSRLKVNGPSGVIMDYMGRSSCFFIFRLEISSLKHSGKWYGIIGHQVGRGTLEFLGFMWQVQVYYWASTWPATWLKAKHMVTILLTMRTWEDSSLQKCVLHASGIKDDAPPIRQQVLLNSKEGRYNHWLCAYPGPLRHQQYQRARSLGKGNGPSWLLVTAHHQSPASVLGACITGGTHRIWPQETMKLA